MEQQTERLLLPELRAGERLVWAGQPRGGIRLVAADAFMIPFSLLWGGFAVFWEYGALQQAGPSFFALFGVPFVLVGLYVIFGRFFFDAYRRSRTYYALTDQRVLILTHVFGHKLQSLSLASLGQVSISERSDRGGTITLGPSGGMSAWFAGSGWPGSGKEAPPALEAVENVRAVFDGIMRGREALAIAGPRTQR
jgi:hypothetical protein